MNTPRKEFDDFGAKIRKGKISTSRPGDENDISELRSTFSLGTKNLTKTSFQSVSDDSIHHFTADSQADSGGFPIGFMNHSPEMGSAESDSMIKDDLKITTSTDPAGPWKSVICQVSPLIKP